VSLIPKDLLAEKWKKKTEGQLDNACNNGVDNFFL